MSDLEGLFSYFIADPAHGNAIAKAHQGPLNTDDRNLLEFGFARSVGKDKLFSLPEALDRSRAQGSDRAARLSAELDWDRVNRERERQATGPRARGKADFDAERATMSELLDRTVEAMAQGRDAQPALLRRLREVAPYAVDALEADALHRAGESEEALALLERIFEGFRKSPWLEARVVSLSLALLKRIAKSDAALTRRALESLTKPFAARAANDTRLEAVLELSATLEPAQECVRALAAFEPWVPWNETFLERRVHCYERAQDARLGRARADLEAFVAAKPAPDPVASRPSP